MKSTKKPRLQACKSSNCTFILRDHTTANLGICSRLACIISALIEPSEVNAAFRSKRDTLETRGGEKNKAAL